MWRVGSIGAIFDFFCAHHTALPMTSSSCIIDAFPTIRHKDEAQYYGEYCTKRLALEAFDDHDAIVS